MLYTNKYVQKKLDAIERVRQLHSEITPGYVTKDCDCDECIRYSSMCMECDQVYPCDTILALDNIPLSRSIRQRILDNITTYN